MSLALIAHPAAVLAKSSGGITLDPIAKPIAAVLAFFYGLVPNYGAAIILLTVAVMVILTPLTIKQTRSMLVMQKLQPELKRLQEEHKNDRQALNEAVMAMYKEHNASPLGGCLPMLLPFPVFFALFRVLEGLSRMVKDPLSGKVGSNPKYLTSSTRMYHDIQRQKGTLKAFGMDLSKSANNAGGTFLHTLPYLVLLLLMVGTQYYQQRQLTSRNPAAAQGQQAQIMKFFPILFGVLSIRFPAGVVVYWTVSNIIRIFQQWAMYRYDPKVKALVEADVKEVEDKTREIEAKPSRPRFRDLLSGAAGQARGNDPKAGGRPATGKQGRAKPAPRAGGKPGSGKAGSGKPGGGKPAGRPAGARPAGDKAGSGKAGSGKAGSDKPGIGKPAPTRADGTGNGSPATITGKSGPNRDGQADDTPGKSPSPPAAGADGTANKNGASTGRTGRTGGGAARTGGNRGKRARRGR